MLVSILFGPENYDLFEKLQSLHFNSYNIFENDNIYKINKEKKHKSNVNDPNDFWSSCNRLVNKPNKTPLERRFLDQIIKEINSV